MNPLLQRISIDPSICGGKPCINGTRIWVSLILDFLADGMSEAELLTEYPQLVHEDVLAALAYGAEAALASPPKRRQCQESLIAARESPIERR